MITRLRIKNFKSLRDTGELRIRPLTFLLGPNSSGKSSIIQSLLLLRQTVDSPDLTNPLIINGNYVQLGSYRDLVFSHLYRNHVRFEFTLQPEDGFVFRWPHMVRTGARGRRMPAIERYEIESLNFSCEFAYSIRKQQILLWNAEFQFDPAESKVSIKRDQIRLERDGESRVMRGLPTRKFYGLAPIGLRALAPGADDEEAWIFTSLTLSEAASQIERLFQRVFYVGPLREWPRRVYVATGETPQDVGFKGERAVDVLWVQTRTAEERGRFLGLVNHWVREFGIATEARLQNLGANNYSLMFTDPHTNLRVNLADVGFGASQVFPIIVGGFYAPAKSTLLIEQPEIHLHPRAQAALADLLVAIAMERERGRALLVETHSEHLISRVQRRVAEGELPVGDVAIYYCDPTSEGTDVREIRLNELGQFEPEGLPEGFFEEGYKESMEHMRALAGARKG
jgi:predicted ATPase